MQDPADLAVRPDHLRIFFRQLPFAAVLVALVVGFVTFEPAVFQHDLVLAGLIVALFATALSITLPWHRIEGRWAGVVPLLDIAAIGLLQAGELNSGYILVLPVLWMSMMHGAAGMITSVVAATVAVWSTELPVPDLAGIEVLELQRLVLLPIILAGVGIYLYLAERRSSARRDLLSRQSSVLEQTLAASREQQRLLGAVLDTIDVGVVVLGADGRVTLTNHTHTWHTRGMLEAGDTVDEGFLRQAEAYEADGKTPLAEEALPLALAADDPEHQLTWWGPDGGERRAFRVSARQLTEDGGRGGAVVAYQDLTSEMAALAQLEDFVSSVSHELRTPLTSIMGYLDLAMEDERLSHDTRAQLEVAERNAARLLRLIGDLLTAAQTRRGQLSLNRGSTDLDALIAEAVQNQAPRADAAGISLAVLGDTGVIVDVDRSRMTQVVDNLLSNAIKYSRRGGAVEIGVRREHREVCLWVRDDGIGIAEADQDRIFTRFFRADAVRKGPVQGTGLGLHITRQIVEAHGGSITLASELGHGTEVVVRLPGRGEDA